MKRIITSLVICVCVIVSTQAQEKEPVKEKSGHHLGLFAGASSGYGLSYRFLKKKVGFQVTTTPIFSSNNIHLSIGGQFINSFHRSKYTNFYGYLGCHYNYNKYSDEWDSVQSDNIDVTTISGVGVGFELIAGNRVGFNWQLGYGFYYFDTDDWSTMIDGGFGIYYKL